MQKNELTKHIDFLLSQALKKCENPHDAEDLVGETLLSALSYIEKGNTINDLRGWLLTVLNHKRNDLLRQKYRRPIIGIGEGFDIAEDTLLSESIEKSEEAMEVRRAVAYLARLHREVIVRHYMNGESVSDIAKALRVSEGTVKSRLYGGREQIRKGIIKMENYAKQSYAPERLVIACNGRPGFHDEPWSLVENDLMKQNILIVAYQKPLTVPSIAKALGIPTPYIENAVDELVHSELMYRKSDKVFTDFIIYTPEERLKVLDEEIELADKLYNVIWNCIKALFSDIQKLSFYEKFGEFEINCLKYYAMLDVFSKGVYTALKTMLNTTEDFPTRPDGGAWIAQGHRLPADFNFDDYRVGKYCYGGERRAYWERFLSSKSIDLHVYDTQPYLNKYEHGPVEIHDDKLCKLLYIIHKGIQFDDVGFDLCYLETIPHLAECGILRYESGCPKVTIPILKREEFDEIHKTVLVYIKKLTDILFDPLKTNMPKLKLNIPSHLEGRVAEHRQYFCYSIPMAIIKKAVEKNEFFTDINSPTPPMVLVIEE